MTEELDKAEARQSEERRMNRRVLFWGTVVAFAILAILWFIWVRTA
jgi:hypothetical protein